MSVSEPNSTVAAADIPSWHGANAAPDFVIGATGNVGGHIVRLLNAGGRPPLALSREERAIDGAAWIRGDLSSPGDITPGDFRTIYSTVYPALLAAALPTLARPSLKRVVFITSTSLVTKADSRDDEERLSIEKYAAGERQLIAACDRLGIKWTVLRPTLIYDEGRDQNITRLAQIISRFGFFPLYGRGAGRRQPVHAEDLALGAIGAATSRAAENKIYDVPGGETLPYREMVGRIFDGLGRRRLIVPLPPALWRLAFAVAQRHFPRFNSEMGARMTHDMVFDGSRAQADFGWRPRGFNPRFTDGGR